jgi:outer membrane protein assembly factor BamD (BamD/ComL family)
MGNGSFCGDFEGSIEELQETIALHKRFLTQFPNSRFVSQAKQELSQSEEQLAKALKSSNHQ